MTITLKLQGRLVSDSDIRRINQLIKENPLMSRRQLSIELCKAWDWRNDKGELKDMASRSLMLKLHERGLITLPERRQAPSSRMTQKTIIAIEHDVSSIEEKLNTLTPLNVTRIEAKTEEAALFDYLLAEYHYLSHRSTVGENMKYLVRDIHHRPLACLLFGSSAWSCHARDQAIGWSPKAREKNINKTTNNTRFLILPWVKVPHLASHLLAKIAKRIHRDWLERYGHPVYLLETFVDRSRFQGTCYKAANWQYAGNTQGRTRNDRQHTINVSTKSVYLYPLTPNFRKKLAQ